MTDALSGIPGLERGLLSDQIYDLVKSMIKSSQLAPGEQLVESQLARRLRVSQAPVRDALKQLAHEGLVTHVRHQGNFVTKHSDEEAQQAKQARVALEALAGRLTCGRLTAETRARLEEVIAAMHTAVDAQDLPAFRELDFGFHRAIIEASGNTYLPRMWDIIEPSLRSMHLLGDPEFTGDWHQVADWHRSLLDVLDAGDADAASALFEAHAAGTLLDAEGDGAPHDAGSTDGG
ncbi:GntR family transcriptional regulator [Promicromonospora kroppenstedtii]|uniref:GntR family transcriptional regulator n=1 Tax=Promicromonospora kroppenstedtii TaxID=440482 RepID=A0ABW7XFD7_9MICO